jgi:hypothetical protein
VSLRGHAISFLYIGDETTDLHDVASEFVPDDERRLAAPLGPRVPVVDVNIGATHPRAPHTNENFILADSRLGNILELETRRG